VEAFASDLRAIRGTIAGPVALVGASMGGMTGFYAIGSDPRPLAQALVMVDITLRPAEAGKARIVEFMSRHTGGFVSLDEAVNAVANYNRHRPRPANPGGLSKNLRRRADGRLYWHWDPRFIERSSSFLDALLRVSGSVRLPTLLVRGGRSDVVDDAAVAEMRQLVPQTEVCDVGAAGHMIVGDDNDAFIAGTLGFLERHFPSR
jgi:pimeloyl-ACP methyl ester carboxylesterase